MSAKSNESDFKTIHLIRGVKLLMKSFKERKQARDMYVHILGIFYLHAHHTLKRLLEMQNII